MINLLIILFFIGYSLAVFLVNNLWFLLGCAIFNIALLIILKVNFMKTIKNLLTIFVFIAIVFLVNIIFSSVIDSLIVCAKIIIVCNFSFIISYSLSVVKIAEGISYLLYPLKLFKVNINEITLLIVLALNFVSVIKREALNLKLTLKARNIKLNFKTLFTKTHIIFIMFFANIFRRVDMLELSLRSKGFN